MRKFEKELRLILEEWKMKKISSAEVFSRAEKLLDEYNDEFPIYPYTKDKNGNMLFIEANATWEAIPFEVLSELSQMHHEWITSSDIPAMLKFIEASSSETISSWKDWIKYREGIDWIEREKEVKTIGWPPYYIP